MVARTKRVKQRKALLAVLWTLSAAFLYGILFGDHGMREFASLRSRLDARSAEAHHRIVRNHRLLDHLEGLRDDPRVLEQVARTRLGVAGDDEIVFVFREVSRIR